MAGVEACRNLAKERYACDGRHHDHALHQPGTILDPLTEIARDWARRMLMAARKAEAAGFVAQVAEERLPDGRQRVVLHGAAPERTVQTGIGAIPVRRPKSLPRT